MRRLQFCDWNGQRKFFKKFFKDKDAVQHFPSSGEGTLSGIIVDADNDTGLARKSLSRLILGGNLKA